MSDKQDQINLKISKKQEETNDKKSECEHELEGLKKQVEEYKNKYLRALADYQNFEKRANQEKDEIRNNAEKYLISKLLTVLDNLDKAEIFIKDQHLQLIKNNLFKLLKDEGVEEIKVLGKEYDPYTAEVIDVISGEKENIIVEVLRKGYKLNGKILRVAQVKVTKKK